MWPVLEREQVAMLGALNAYGISDAVRDERRQRAPRAEPPMSVITERVELAAIALVPRTPACRRATAARGTA